MSPRLVRLLVFANRKAIIRLSAITVGIAVGTAGLLLLAGAFVGLQDRDIRGAWLDAGTQAPSSARALTDDQVLARHLVDRFAGRDIDVVAVAATAGSTVEIPGLTRAPEAGAYAPSPALAELIQRESRSGLGLRYGHRRDAELGPSALPSPDSLVVIMGVEPEEFSERDRVRVVSSFVGPQTSQLVANDAVRTIVAIGAVGILIPVVLLVSVVTQLGLAEREEALATLRLIGAPTTVAGRIAAVEAALTAVVGSVLGVAIAVIARPWAARITIGDGRFYPADLELSPPVVATCCLVLVAAVITTATRRARRGRIGPTGVSRQQAEPKPTRMRLAPLAAGIATLAVLPTGLGGGWIAEGLPASIIMIAGFLATALGLMVTGPYLTHVLASWATRTTGSAAGLIAAGRVTSAPRAIFRSVSGLVIATFMVSVFAVAASAGAPEQAEDGEGKLPPDALALRVPPQQAASLAAVLADLAATPGVSRVVVAYQPATGTHDVPRPQPSKDTWIIATADAIALGLTPGDSSAAYQAFVSTDLLSASAQRQAELVATPYKELGKAVGLLVRTEAGSAREQARTAMEAALPLVGPPLTRAELAELSGNRLIAQLYSLAGAGMFIAITVAGVTLAVSAVAAIIDRRRLLGMLRLVGTPVPALRWAIAYEVALPLTATLLASVALGSGVGYFIVTSLSSAQPTMPAAEYFLALGAGLLVAALIITLSLTAVRSATGSEVTRYE